MKATEKNYINLVRKRREEGLLYAVETYGWVIQSVVRKHFIEEATIEEISAEMGLNESTIYQRISRGRKKLRKHKEIREAGQ